MSVSVESSTASVSRGWGLKCGAERESNIQRGLDYPLVKEPGIACVVNKPETVNNILYFSR